MLRERPRTNGWHFRRSAVRDAAFRLLLSLGGGFPARKTCGLSSWLTLSFPGGLSGPARQAGFRRR